jgi:ankyrin repeat protein
MHRNQSIKSIPKHVLQTHIKSDDLRELLQLKSVAEGVSTARKFGIDLRKYDDYALRWASGNGYLDVVQYLVSQIGANVNANGGEPLTASAEGRYLQIVRYLVAKGAKVSQETVELATKNYDLPMIRYLLSHGGVINNSAMESLEKFLVEASRDGNLNIVTELIGLGVDPNYGYDDYGLCAFQLAAQEGHFNIVKYLYSHGARLESNGNGNGNGNGTEPDDETLEPLDQLLFDVIQKSLKRDDEMITEYLQIAQFLIGIGANREVLNDIDLLGRVYDAHQKAVSDFLVSNTVSRKFSEDALSLASANNFLNNVKILLAKGVNIHTDDDFALKIASENGNLDIVKYLVEHGANVQAEDNYAVKAAHDERYVEIVEILVSHGAKLPK